ncbi:MAG: nucleotidyltransferase domain-containing protein [Bauldia sp.]
MNRAEAFAGLGKVADAVRARGATSLYVFGSVARDESRTDSDVDLFIDYDSASKFSLVDLVGIKNLIEDELGVEVDIATRDSLDPRVLDLIEKSAIRVF